MFIQIFLKDCPDMLSPNETMQAYADHVSSIPNAKIVRAVLTPSPKESPQNQICFTRRAEYDQLYRIKANSIILAVMSYGFCLFACLMVAWAKIQYIEAEDLTTLCLGGMVCSLLGAGIVSLSYKHRKYKLLLIEESQIMLEQLYNAINMRRNQRQREVTEPRNLPPRKHQRIIPVSQQKTIQVKKEVERWDVL